MEFLKYKIGLLEIDTQHSALDALSGMANQIPEAGYGPQPFPLQKGKQNKKIKQTNKNKTYIHKKINNLRLHSIHSPSNTVANPSTVHSLVSVTFR